MPNVSEDQILKAHRHSLS